MDVERARATIAAEKPRPLRLAEMLRELGARLATDARPDGEPEETRAREGVTDGEPEAARARDGITVGELVDRAERAEQLVESQPARWLGGDGLTRGLDVHDPA